MVQSLCSFLYACLTVVHKVSQWTTFVIFKKGPFALNLAGFFCYYLQLWDRHARDQMAWAFIPNMSKKWSSAPKSIFSAFYQAPLAFPNQNIDHNFYVSTFLLTFFFLNSLMLNFLFFKSYFQLNMYLLLSIHIILQYTFHEENIYIFLFRTLSSFLVGSFVLVLLLKKFIKVEYKVM